MRVKLFFLFFCFSVVAFSQQTDYVDFISINAEIVLHPNAKETGGSAIYTFNILKDIDSIYIDAKNINHYEINVNNLKAHHSYDGKHIIFKKYQKKFIAGNTYSFNLIWFANPKKSIYFVGWDNESPNQVWTQGQGKYTSNWLPSIDDMNDKIEFDLSITFNNDYEVIANGKLIDKQIGEEKTIWHYDMQKPMSSYLVALAIGKYNKKEETSKSGIPLEMYYYPEDSSKVESTYRYTKRMFDFLEKEIGVPYPWQNYKQVPVHDFLYSGMENTSLTIFSDAFVVDSIGFNDRSYVNVNAHELAHQWFGNLVTETSGTHHWLQEGFATYYALLAEREIFGDNYYYWRLYEYAQELLEQDSRNQGTSLLNPKSSSVTFYKKGAWLLHILREKVGDKAFKIAVKNYLQKHQFKNVETSDFINEVTLSSGKNLNEFVTLWLEDTVFPYNVAMASLEQSMFIQEYLMADCEAMNAKCDYYLSAPLSPEAKSKIVMQIPNRVTSEVFNDDLKVRQAIAEAVTQISPKIQEDYESLLDDESYITIEAALYHLWLNFPDKRTEYLNKTKDIIGLNDKNVRMIWLVLALSSNYEVANKQAFFNELANYTSPDYNSEVRQSAFTYLQALDLFPDDVLRNLIDATKHHNWRFKSFSKDLLEVLSNDIKYQEKINLLKLKK